MIDEAEVQKVEAFIQAEFMKAKPGYVFEEERVDMQTLYSMMRALGSTEQVVLAITRKHLARLCQRFVADQIAAPGRPSFSAKLMEEHGRTVLMVRTEMPTMATDPLVVPGLEATLVALTKKVSDVADRMERSTSLHGLIYDLRKACEEARR